MKVIGSLIIVLSFWLIGNMSSGKLSKRVIYLKIMINALEFIKNEITYNLTSIRCLSQKLSNNDYFKKISLFDDLYKNLLRNQPFEKSWNLSVKNSDISSVLSKEEINEIKRIGSWLGASSLSEQILNIDCVLNFLRCELVQAQEEMKKYYRIYNSFGFLFGLTLVILIW